MTVRLSVWEYAVVTAAAAREGGLGVAGWLAQAAMRQAETLTSHAQSAQAVSQELHGGDASLASPPVGADLDLDLGHAGLAAELRAAVRQLVRYGVLLNQLVAHVHATGDVAGLAEGLRVAINRCEARSAAVAVLAAELAVGTSSPGQRGARPASAPRSATSGAARHTGPGTLANRSGGLAGPPAGGIGTGGHSTDADGGTS